MALVQMKSASGDRRKVDDDLDVIRKYVEEIVNYEYKNAWNWIASWFMKKPDMPNMFLVGNPSVDDVLSYRQAITRSTKQPYTVKHRLRYEGQVITAISVLPLNRDLHCPEVDIIDGGMNFRHVELCLRPIKSGEWGCGINICGSQVKKTPWEELLLWFTNFFNPFATNYSKLAIRDID